MNLPVERAYQIENRLPEISTIINLCNRKRLGKRSNQKVPSNGLGRFGILLRRTLVRDGGEWAATFSPASVGRLGAALVPEAAIW
jgi:hypothetical protein